MKKFLTLILVALASLLYAKGQTTAHKYIELMKSPDIDVAERVRLADRLGEIDTLSPQIYIAQRAQAYRRSGRFAQSRALYSQLADSASLPPNVRLDAVYWMAWYAMVGGRSHEALDHLYEIFTQEKPDSLDYYDIDAAFLVAAIYRNLHNSRMADCWLDKAEKRIATLRCDSAHINNSRYRLHYERAGNLLQDGNWRDALIEHSKALRYNPDPESLHDLMLDKAQVFEMQGDYPKAVKCLRLYLDEASPGSMNRYYAMHNLALMLVRGGNAAQALRELPGLIADVRQRGLSQIEAAMWLVMAEACDSLGFTAEAYRALRRQQAINDSIGTAETDFSATEATANFENLLAARETEALRRQVNHRKAVTVALIAGIIIVVGIALLMWLKFRRRSAAATRLNRQLRMNEKSHAEEMARSRSEREERHREILELTMRVAQADSLITELKRLSADRTRNSAEIMRELKLLLRGNTDADNMWDVFNIHFTRTHPRFMTTLAANHPTLTTGELRMCAFMAMNLSTKETARMLNRSPRSVESMKYRLHKKLGLQPGVTTVSYLHTILTADNRPPAP